MSAIEKSNRNVLKFRDFEMDEDDYRVLDNMLSKPGNLNDDPEVYTVWDAVNRGCVSVAKNDNDERRVTSFRLNEFRDGIIPAEIGNLDGLKEIDFEDFQNLKSLPEEIFQLFAKFRKAQP